MSLHQGWFKSHSKLSAGRVGKEAVAHLVKGGAHVRLGLRQGDAHPKADWLKALGAQVGPIYVILCDIV